MITFFKKIRQQLLTENKFSKYLIYTIGEIVASKYNSAIKYLGYYYNSVQESAQY